MNCMFILYIVTLLNNNSYRIKSLFAFNLLRYAYRTIFYKLKIHFIIFFDDQENITFSSIIFKIFRLDGTHETRKMCNMIHANFLFGSYHCTLLSETLPKKISCYPINHFTNSIVVVVTYLLYLCKY